MDAIPVKKTFDCQICDKSFMKRSHLVLHLRIHSGVRPYKCEMCEKSFVHNSHLKSHIKIHTGERPFPCQVCGKAFSRNSKLKRHMVTHTGETPFECEVCQKRFPLKALLKRHLKVHTGERPYECLICGKAFSQSGHLKRHFSTHTGEKPYLCKVCGKAFSQSGHLVKHSKIHLREENQRNVKNCRKPVEKPKKDTDASIRENTNDAVGLPFTIGPAFTLKLEKDEKIAANVKTEPGSDENCSAEDNPKTRSVTPVLRNPGTSLTALTAENLENCNIKEEPE